MRFVVVSLDPGVPVFGAKGCSVHVQEVLRVLTRRSADVHVVTTRLGGPAPVGLEGVTVHHLELPGGRSPAERERDLVDADTRAAELVAELLHGRDAVLYERYALFSCGAVEAARVLGVPAVLEVNAPLPLEQARHRSLSNAEQALERTELVFSAATRVIAVSSPVADWVRSVTPGADVRVVPNGVDLERFSPVSRNPDGALTVAFVGAFRPWHGVDLLVEAAGRLTELPGPAVRLLLVGDGPGRPTALARAAELGLDVVAPGAVAPGEVPAELAAADVACAPYPAGRAYFSPLKIAEYLACGLPTVSAAVGDLPTSYADGKELLLTAPGDLDALTAALQRLRTDPDLRARLSRAGRRAVEERFGWDRTVDLSLSGLPRSGPVRTPEQVPA